MDTARIQETATSTLTIEVSRNEFSPVFAQSEQRITINDRWSLGQKVAVVSATDDDTEVGYTKSTMTKVP